MFKRTIIPLIFIFTSVLTADAQKRIPAVDDLMNVKSLSGAQISPDGKWVVYLVEEADWKQDGSAGYGEKFRQLNVRNLGVGDAWDVLSGVDHLIARGWVDPKRVGCMGWSQGGYISAFLTTSTDRFAAISVGAGISNWATYYTTRTSLRLPFSTWAITPPKTERFTLRPRR